MNERNQGLLSNKKENAKPSPHAHIQKRIEAEKLRCYKRRWQVERLFARFQSFRRVLVRFDNQEANFFVLVQIAYIVILLKNFFLRHLLNMIICTMLNFSGHSGKIINTHRIGRFCLTENVYAPQTFVPKHSHQKACFCFIVEGSYHETFGHKVVEASPSTLIFRPAGEIHSDHFGTAKTRSFIIEFENEWLAEFGNNALKLNEPTCFQGFSLTWLAVKLREESQNLDDFSSLTIEGLMFELVAEIGRKMVKAFDSKQPRWLKDVKEFLRENFAEHVSLSKIANSVDVHPVYLAETFRRHYHCTVGEYVRQLRIEFASHEISKTDASLAEIGLAAGFAHQAHFSRTFKHLTGLSPAQFRSISRRKS